MEVILTAESKITDENHLSSVFPHKKPFAITCGLLGKSPLGTNHYMLHMNEGGTNTLLHDLGVEGEINRFAGGG